MYCAVCKQVALASKSGESKTMYATNLHCSHCNANCPLTHRGSCPTCATTGEESALNETLGVQYDLTAIKRHLDRDELARRPAGLWRYRDMPPVVAPALPIDVWPGGTTM